MWKYNDNAIIFANIKNASFNLLKLQHHHFFFRSVSVFRRCSVFTVFKAENNEGPKNIFLWTFLHTSIHAYNTQLLGALENISRAKLTPTFREFNFGNIARNDKLTLEYRLLHFLSKPDPVLTKCSTAGLKKNGNIRDVRYI